ncbi:MAG: MFS transporter [Anaerolineae bacterium]|nr:MFS transporter [Anaerolineae bacterium]
MIHIASIPTTLFRRVSGIPRELKLFIGASMMMGMAYSIIDATFNNFLNTRFALTGFERSFLEFPREIPGVLVVFVSALLWFLCSRRLGAVSLLLSAVGALLIGFISSSYTTMVIWLFIYSMGQHLFMPVASAIGMELAREGKTGRRLGQLNSVRNMAVVVGSFAVFLGFKYLNFDFQHTFSLSALIFTIAAMLMFAMKSQDIRTPATYLELHREYRLYYIMAVLSGSRKQIFITFAPWVLVTIFNQPTQLLAKLLTIGGIVGIVFQPVLGWMIDRLGERIVLASEAVMLVFVCLGYGFSRFVLPEDIAFLVVCACYILDQMLFSVSMARSTYMKKIALQPAHIQPALSASVTIDHIFSISVALIGGVLWNTFGFQSVFLLGVVIALGTLLAALQVRLPKHDAPSVPGAG